MANVKVDVSFYSKQKIMLATLTLRETETIGNLKIKLKSKIDVFKNQEVVIVDERENGFFTILNDHDKVENFKGRNNVTFRAFPKFIKCVIKTSEIYEQREIDVTSRVFDITYNIIDRQPQKYIAGFQKQDVSNSVFYPCSMSLPLCVQGWFHDTLFLIRRLYIDDTTDELDSNNAKFLLENCRIANNLSLSCYDIDVWGQLSAFQFLYEKVELLTESYVRQNISRFVSPPVKAESESDLIDRTIYHIRKSSKMDPDSALRLYLVTSVTEGCQCSYTEKVKFKIQGAPWFWQTRYLFLCPERICIAKENTYNPHETIKTSDILETKYDGENVIVELLSHVKWLIKSSRPQILMSVLNELIRDPFKDFPDRFSQQQMREALKKKLEPKNLLTDNESSMAVVAPVIQHKEDQSSDFESEPGLVVLRSNDFKFQSQSTSEKVSQIPSPSSILTGASSGFASQVSSFSLDDEITDILPAKLPKRIRRLRMKPKCLPKIKIPNDIEKDQEFDLKLNSLKVIAITKPVDDTSSVIEEETLVPTVEDFFEYNGKEELASNGAIFVWIALIYILLTLLGWMKGFFTHPAPK